MTGTNNSRNTHLCDLSRSYDLEYAVFRMQNSFVHLLSCVAKQRIAWIGFYGEGTDTFQCDILTCIKGRVVSQLHFDSFVREGLTAIRSFFEASDDLMILD